MRWGLVPYWSKLNPHEEIKSFGKPFRWLRTREINAGMMARYGASAQLGQTTRAAWDRGVLR